MKKIFRDLFLTLIALSIGVTVARGFRFDSKSSSLPPLSDGTAVSPAKDGRVIAYYFHGTNRCPTCKKIEAYTREALESSFPDALKNGTLEILSVNVDEPANKHFVDDYKLDTRSVVLAEVRVGKQVRWKTLEKVWELVGEKAEFLSYIQSETGAFLNPV